MSSKMIISSACQGVVVKSRSAPVSCAPFNALQPVRSRLCPYAYGLGIIHKSRSLPCSRAGTRSPAVQVVAFKSADSHSQSIKNISQLYINKCAKPLTKAALHVYKFQEEIFDQLLRTPDLDKQLRAGNKPLHWATTVVEAAIAEAIDIAFTSGSRRPGAYPNSTPDASRVTSPEQKEQQNGHSSSNDSPARIILAGRESPVGALSSADNADSYDGNVVFADGMGVVQSFEPSAGPEGGCASDDEMCDTDWDVDGEALSSMQELLPDEEEAHSAAHMEYTRAPSPALAGVIAAAGAHNGPVTNTLDMPDELAAKGAVKIEAVTEERFDVTAARLFLQRILYKINRLNHFWYDDLNNYVNERSAWLAHVRDMIEDPWQAWEQQQMAAAAAEAGGSDNNVAAFRAMSLEEIKQALRERYTRDVDPPLSAAQQFVASSMGPLGYCHLLAVGSVDGLVEASRQSRVCAGAANQVACAIFRVLMEEYGTGRYNRKHSTFYKIGMEELGLNTKEEHYLDLLPWQWLAAANHNFLLTERRRNYLRYAGALSFFEINGPSVYKTYLAAAERCGLSESASGYWALHIKEDERHGKQMLDEVALPLVDMYPRDAWELLWGYDQDRFMGARAGAALVGHIQAADAMAREMTGAGSDSSAQMQEQQQPAAVHH